MRVKLTIIIIKLQAQGGEEITEKAQVGKWQQSSGTHGILCWYSLIRTHVSPLEMMKFVQNEKQIVDIHHAPQKHINK